MKPAEKLAMVMDMFQRGLLCDCDEIAPETRPDSEYFDDELEQVIVHRKDCQAGEKMKELLELK